jgi:hypothetical protein
MPNPALLRAVLMTEGIAIELSSTVPDAPEGVAIEANTAVPGAIALMQWPLAVSESPAAGHGGRAPARIFQGPPAISTKSILELLIDPTFPSGGVQPFKLPARLEGGLPKSSD